MFDRGHGPPLVIVPGVHGRWEWMKPALDKLAGSCRTISYSLCGDIGSGQHLDPEQGFDNYLRQLDAVLDRSGVEKVALCGVSFGGFVALQVRRDPTRSSFVARARLRAGAWMAAQPAAGQVDRAAVDLGADFRDHLTHAACGLRCGPLFRRGHRGSASFSARASAPRARR